METKYFWLATRDGEPCGSFETRREAIKWLKSILKQEFADYSKQDQTDEFDYNIELPKIEIRQYELRKTFLGF